MTPLGSHKPVAVDVALIGATHRNLREMIEDKAFREDLYYRLNGLVVRLPPLRERSDLRALVPRICGEECRGTAADARPRRAGAVPALSLARQHAPARQRAAHRRGDGRRRAARSRESTCPTTSSTTAAQLRAAPAAARRGRRPRRSLRRARRPRTGTLEEVEVEMIRRAVQAAGGNISEASKRLGISRNTIYRKLRWNAPA